MTEYALGIDLSLNHAGFVCLRCDTLRVRKAIYVTASTAAIKKAADKVEALRIPNWQNERKRRSDVDFARLVWWHKALRLLSRDPIFSRANYVGIEGYTFRGTKRGFTYQHAYAEIGGAARFIFRNRNVRIHDPLSVKLYGSGSGHIETKDLKRAVKEKWDVAFSRFDGPAKTAPPSEDLTVAYVLARMVAVEYLVRVGIVRTHELEETELRVFNRVTKSNPVNVLAQDWLTARVPE